MSPSSLDSLSPASASASASTTLRHVFTTLSEAAAGSSANGTNTTDHEVHYSIFDRHSIALLPLTFIMAGLILFTITFEVLIHFLEHQLLGRHPAYLAMLNKIYKELMILGFISFTTLLLLQFIDFPHKYFIMFEFAHVWVFVIAVVFVLHGMAFMSISRRAKQHWEEMNAKPESELVIHLEQQPEPQPSRFYCVDGIKRLWQWLFWDNDREELEFQAAKHLFLRHHVLPPQFDFSYYLKTHMTRHIIGILDVRPSTWCLLVLVLCINLLRNFLANRQNPNTEESLDAESELVFFIIVGYVIFAIDLLLLLMVRVAKDRMLRNGGCATRRQQIDFVKLQHAKGQLIDRVKAAAMLRAASAKVLVQSHVEGAPVLTDTGDHIPLNKRQSTAPNKDDTTSTTTTAASSPKSAATAQTPKSTANLVRQGTQPLLIKPTETTKLDEHGAPVVSIELTSIRSNGTLRRDFTYRPNLLRKIFPCGGTRMFARLSEWVMLLQVIKHFVFIEATTTLQAEVFNDTIELMEEDATMKREFTSRLHGRLREKVKETGKSPRECLMEMFMVFDTDGNAKIDPFEFALLLQDLDIHLHTSQLKRLIRLCDTDGTGAIDIKELCELALPQRFNKVRRAGSIAAGVTSGVTSGTVIPELARARSEASLPEEEKQQRTSMEQSLQKPHIPIRPSQDSIAMESSVIVREIDAVHDQWGQELGEAYIKCFLGKKLTCENCKVEISVYQVETHMDQCVTGGQLHIDHKGGGIHSHHPALGHVPSMMAHATAHVSGHAHAHGSVHPKKIKPRRHHPNSKPHGGNKSGHSSPRSHKKDQDKDKDKHKDSDALPSTSPALQPHAATVDGTGKPDGMLSRAATKLASRFHLKKHGIPHSPNLSASNSPSPSPSGYATPQIIGDGEDVAASTMTMTSLTQEALLGPTELHRSASSPDMALPSQGHHLHPHSHQAQRAPLSFPNYESPVDTDQVNVRMLPSLSLQATSSQTDQVSRSSGMQSPSPSPISPIAHVGQISIELPSQAGHSSSIPGSLKTTPSSTPVQDHSNYDMP